jgi:hypothetical protein
MIRVGVFCDVENVVSTFALMKQKVRFERLLNFVKEESEREGKILWKAVAFVPKKESHENLINALSFQGWRIKANMDLDMAIEILQTSPYLIDLLSKMGKRVWVIGTRKGSVAIDLIRVSEDYKVLEFYDELKHQGP